MDWKIFFVKTDKAEYYLNKIYDGVNECYEKYCTSIANMRKDEIEYAVSKYTEEIKRRKNGYSKICCYYY